MIVHMQISRSRTNKQTNKRTKYRNKKTKSSKTSYEEYTIWQTREHSEHCTYSNFSATSSSKIYFTIPFLIKSPPQTFLHIGSNAYSTHRLIDSQTQKMGIIPVRLHQHPLHIKSARHFYQNTAYRSLHASPDRLKRPTLCSPIGTSSGDFESRRRTSALKPLSGWEDKASFR